jgi:uncharacterized protein YbjT (DUF2867 family)
MNALPERPSILVTGATGYIGGRLARQLLDEGHAVRAMARDPRRLAALERAGAECIAGDVLDAASLTSAVRGIDVAYYLVHSMGEGRDFEERDRQAATNFAHACQAAGVKRIIYLGGLGKEGPTLSRHLASRQETGKLLRQGTVPVTELRAAIIVGAGSASFEIVRDLAKRLRVMVCPRWVRSRCEPIVMHHVIAYLVGVLRVPQSVGQVLEIGGGEILTYEEMLRQCAEVMGKKILIFRVPVLSPRLSSYWLNLITSVPMAVARPLVEGLRNDVVATDRRIHDWIPLERVTFREAAAIALAEEGAGPLPSRWTSAALRRSERLGTSGVVLRDERVRSSRASPEALFRAVERIGGATGWYYGNGLWRLRGMLDRMFGGVGLRRGRRHPEEIVPGDAVDFWRVEEYVPGRLLRLRAEMKVPGAAVLEFEVDARDGGGSKLSQRASFVPNSAWGRVYWDAMRPLHAFVFRGMADGIVRAAEGGR